MYTECVLDLSRVFRPHEARPRRNRKRRNEKMNNEEIRKRIKERRKMKPQEKG